MDFVNQIKHALVMPDEGASQIYIDSAHEDEKSLKNNGLSKYNSELYSGCVFPHTF